MLKVWHKLKYCAKEH